MTRGSFNDPVVGFDLARALEEVTVPAYILDPEGRFRWLNRGAVDLLGDQLGRPFARVVAREHVHLARTEFAKTLLGETRTGDYNLTLLGVCERRVSVRITSVSLWEDKNVVGVFGLAYPAEVASEHMHDARRQRLPELTARQYEVLALLADGLGTTAIARRLGVADETARNHIRALLRQLGVHSRLEAVVKGYRLGLLTPIADN